MSEAEARSRLERAEFGVLGTRDADHGVHLVPVVFVCDGDRLIVPIDTVKPKSTTRLRRLENLEVEPRASLLVDERHDDWSRLWWVRVDLTFLGSAQPTPAEVTLLAEKYPQYSDAKAVPLMLAFETSQATGWMAERPGPA
ncbi:MAG: pyridoxamine 5'-phosphate oxidase family protein [Acidimicrobiia bacterium]|nr:pyridoxamine 5'-phosphate oxidase family protein [Acidimicrobiia bacterium]